VLPLSSGNRSLPPRAKEVANEARVWSKKSSRKPRNMRKRPAPAAAKRCARNCRWLATATRTADARDDRATFARSLAQREQHIEQLKARGEVWVALFKGSGRSRGATEDASGRDRSSAAVGSRDRRTGFKRKRYVCAKETSTNLSMQAEETEAHIAERADAVARTMDEAARVRRGSSGPAQSASRGKSKIALPTCRSRGGTDQSAARRNR